MNIVKAFKAICIRNAAEGESGASPAEVTKYLAERNELADLDTVIDVEKIMRKLRERGQL